MYLLSLELLAARDHLVGLGPLVLGVLVALGLIAAVVLGRRQKAKEPDVPKGHHLREGAWHTRDEYGHETPPNHGPGHQETLGDGTATESPSGRSHEMKPDERRHLPYEFGRAEQPPEDGSAEGEAPPHRDKWDRGGSGHGTG